jgi:zinc transport system permease protein
LPKELFAITFDEEAAKLAGVSVRLINFIFTLLTAIVISISARTVGTLVISSLMVLPVAAAMQISKSYKQTLIYSIIIAVISTISGLFISYYANFKPGGTIVLVSVVILLGVLLYKNKFRNALLKRQLNRQTL